MPDAAAVLEGEHGNLRAALSWAIAAGEPSTALRLGRALWYFWCIRGYTSEARYWLERVLAVPGDVPPSLRAAVLNGLVLVLGSQGNLEAARAPIDRSIALFELARDQLGLGRALASRAILLAMLGELVKATADLERSLSIQRRVGDRWGEGMSLHTAARLTLQRGDAEGALALVGDCLERFGSLGDPCGLANGCWTRGVILAAQAQFEPAEASAREALGFFKRLGEAFGLVPCLATLGRIALLRGAFDRAVRLSGAAEALRASAGGAPLRELGEDPAGVIAQARAALPGQVFASALEEGRAMRLNEAVAYAEED